MRCTAATLIALVLLSGCAAHRPAHSGAAAANAGLSGLDAPAVEILADTSKRIAWPSAHRANSGGFGDNNIEGIKDLVQLGAPLLEIDVRMNRSGVLFLFHDGELRKGNYSGSPAFEKRAPESLVAGEIASIAVAGKPGFKVPLFSAALEAVRGSNSALEIDIKRERESVLRTIVEKVVNAGLQGSVLIQAERPETVRILREEFPAIKSMYRCKSEEDLEKAIALKPAVVELEGWLEGSAVSKLKRNGIRVLVNVAESERDKPSGWKNLFDLGVDIVMTDYPREMLEWLGNPPQQRQ